MIGYLNTDHSSIKCTYSDIGTVFPEVIWHTEKPIVRTAPTPLYLLSKLVRESGYKVVLTGEGADEILAGYDIFKEAKIRKFMERNPKSKFRPHILKRLYPYLASSPIKSLQYAEEFFRIDASNYPDEYYSHLPRWNTTSKMKLFFSDYVKGELKNYNNLDDLSFLISDNVSQYDYMSKSQYLEIKTFLSGYLLSSQGDRMAMANSIEGRFPFLNHRIIEFCCKLPPNLRMQTLTEKYILKKSMNSLLPASIIKRTKQPYMSPDSKSFFNEIPPDYLEELLSEKNLKDNGHFNPKAVSMLIKKCRQSPVIGFKDNMAVVGIISTLLTYEVFAKDFASKSKDIERVVGDKKYAVEV